MASPDKRIDLRFGAFACSVQGFDDPTVPLGQVLRQVGETLAGLPGMEAAVLFDEGTIRRLEAEISAGVSGEVEVVPGLVLTRVAEASEREDLQQLDDNLDAEATDRESVGDVPFDCSPPTFIPSGNRSLGRPRRSSIEHAARQPAKIDPFPRPAKDNPALPFCEDRGPNEDAFLDRAREAIFEVALARRRERDARPAAPTKIAEVGDASKEAAPSPEPNDVNLFAGENEVENAKEVGDAVNLFAGEAVAAPKQPRPDPPTDHAEITPLHDLSRYRRNTVPLHAGEAGPEQGTPLTVSVAEIARAGKAHTVPDLLCASAVWIALVQDHQSFSRREVLDVFDRLKGDHPQTLEAKIKGFGKLVRNGQLKTVDDGHFRLSAKERRRWQPVIGSEGA